MNPSRRTPHPGRRALTRLTGAVALAALMVIATPPAGAHGQGRDGLLILLTNDDGYDAPGLRAMREALLAAGHRVTVVAPLDNRSGSGMSGTTSGVIDYYEQSDGVWAVDGTPADAVSLGLVHVMRDELPDLVISGSNFGQNVGESVLSSGTVGAALTATRQGVPAIAVSVAVGGGGADGRSRTLDAFEPAAIFTVDLVRQLRESDAQGLLPPRQMLNVNYPAVGGGAPTGVRFTPVASVRAFRRVYSVAGPTGPARVQLAAGDVGRAEPGSDMAMLADGYVTISVLDGNLDAGRESWEPLLLRLAIER